MARHFDSHQGEPGLLASVPDSGGSEANLTSPERSYRSYRILLPLLSSHWRGAGSQEVSKTSAVVGLGHARLGRRGLLLARLRRRLRRRPLPDRRPSRSSGFGGRLRLDRDPMCPDLAIKCGLSRSLGEEKLTRFQAPGSAPVRNALDGHCNYLTAV